MVRREDAGGFTIVELVITMSLLLVVTGAILASFVSVQRTEAFAGDRTQTLDALRGSMARMTKDIRQASAVSDNASATHLEIDSYVLGVATHIVFDISGTTLTRSEGSKPAVVLADNLASTQVFAYDPSTTDVQLVTITLQARPERVPDATVTITEEVALRNRGAA